MVGHLHLQAMDDSLKGKNREGLLDSPDSGLPPSPSPPFCSLSPALLESRSGSCTTPVESHHGFYKKESREGKLVREPADIYSTLLSNNLFGIILDSLTRADQNNSKKLETWERFGAQAGTSGSFLSLVPE